MIDTTERMTGEELQALCDRWAKILSLSDWQIKAEFANPWEMDGDAGHAEYRPRLRRAKIRIVRPGTGRDDWINYDDTERILVHELLHVVLCTIHGDDCSPAQEIDEEQAVEALTGALVGLARETSAA